MNINRNLYLPQSPLILVLVQLKFGTVKKMSDFVPDIQERLRGRYPKFRTEQIKTFTLSQTPEVEDSTQWFFGNMSGTSSITLTESFVTLSTSDYSTYEKFHNEFNIIVESLGEFANLNLVERLGLRYVDLIRTDPEEDFSKYLKEPLLGLNPLDVGAERSLNRYEFMGETKQGRILIRCTESVDGTNRPRDLIGIELNYKTTVSPEEKVRFLDFDHFTTESFNYNPSTIMETLSNLHDTCHKAFEELTTPYALEKWGKGE